MRLRYSGIIVILLLAISGFPLAAGCGENIATETPDLTGQIIQDVTVEEAYTFIRQNQLDPTFIIIDVRTPEEFTEGHIERAINIDFRSENFGGQIDALNRGNKYLIYCRSGNRSSGALEVMVEMNFKEVYHLSSGIIKWIDEEYPITR
ncbi:rhodanese-like domain-containing protein [Chloroflexota bacterium]